MYFLSISNENTFTKHTMKELSDKLPRFNHNSCIYPFLLIFLLGLRSILFLVPFVTGGDVAFTHLELYADT